jgi:hypothetical protein
MSRGPSGRIVVEVEPHLKRGLYAELARNGLTFKDWLIQQASSYIHDSKSPVRNTISRSQKRTGNK